MKLGDCLFISDIEGIETEWEEIKLLHQSTMYKCAGVHLYVPVSAYEA